MEMNDKTIINLYSNFILDSIPENHETIIQCCDCKNFIVVKGKTSYDQVLNLFDLNKKFEEKYKDIKLKNTIDLIMYDQKMDQNKKYEFVFYSSDELRKVSEINQNMFSISDFPFGCSWSQGKLLYYYFKFIFQRIPPNYVFNWMKFDVNINDINQVSFEITDDYNQNDSEVLKSAILDCFDFNLSEFQSIAKKLDLENLILNPNSKEDFSFYEIKDFVII